MESTPGRTGLKMSRQKEKTNSFFDIKFNEPPNDPKSKRAFLKIKDNLNEFQKCEKKYISGKSKLNRYRKYFSKDDLKLFGTFRNKKI